MKFKLLMLAVFALLCGACSDNSSNPEAAGSSEGEKKFTLEDVYSDAASDYEFSSKSDVATSGVADGLYGASSGDPLGETSTNAEKDVSNDRKSGLLTAAEWNDLDHWDFWTKLLNENKFYSKTDYWSFYPKNLVAVKVINSDSTALANVVVELYKGDNLEFSTKTDNRGLAYCWINLFDDESKDINAEDFTLRIDEETFKDSLKFTAKNDSLLNFNVVVSNAMQAESMADIAFIVDATGSMSDEIDFLISDLDNIIEHAKSGNSVTLRTAALFYRDENDEYLTRYDDFSDDVSRTQAFVAKQNAEGGGDYPEAVHTALDVSLQKLSWNESARTRIAFLILDAPAHHETKIIESLQKSIALFAKNGIKLIPVAASGIDKDTEFMLRFFELATGGTYVFLTNDSGIGDSHIEASVGEHDVELLSDLMVRLIKKYVE